VARRGSILTSISRAGVPVTFLTCTPLFSKLSLARRTLRHALQIKFMIHLPDHKKKEKSQSKIILQLAALIQFLLQNYVLLGILNTTDSSKVNG